MAEYIIADGLIVDGTGRDGFRGDVLVKDGRILAVGPGLAEGAVGEIIDASGLVVAPGFIDTHTHSDYSLIKNPRGLSSAYQGVTTEVIGNCGLSSFPVGPGRGALLGEYLIGLGYDGEEPLFWSDLDGYAARLNRDGLPTDLVPLVGHGSIRIAVMGYDAREATVDELTAMDRLLAKALEQGAFGLSSGLVYPPGINAPPWELEHLLETVARAGAIYTTHLRGDTVRAAPSLVDSLVEALDAARHCGVRVHVSHLLAKFPNQGSTARIIELLEEAADEGLAVSCDGHPYLAGMTFLASHLPPWVFEGGVGETLRRLSEPPERERVRQALMDTFGHLDQDRFWALNEPVLPGGAGGGSLADMAAERRTSPVEALMDILVEQGEGLFGAMVLLWIYSSEETQRQLLWPGATIGGDGLAWSREDAPSGLAAHPRSWGSFATVLGDYWRDRKLIGLAELVRKLSGLPAEIFGLTDRGRLASDKKADLAIFDPESIADRSTYHRPAYAAGMRHVFLNGRLVIQDGQPTGHLPGRVLRRN